MVPANRRLQNDNCWSYLTSLIHPPLNKNMPLDRRKKKKHLCSDNSELEEVSPALRSSSISDEVFEPLQAEETSSKVMKKKKKKQKKSKRQ